MVDFVGVEEIQRRDEQFTVGIGFGIGFNGRAEFVFVRNARWNAFLIEVADFTIQQFGHLIHAFAIEPQIMVVMLLVEFLYLWTKIFKLWMFFKEGADCGSFKSVLAFYLVGRAFFFFLTGNGARRNQYEQHKGYEGVFHELRI